MAKKKHIYIENQVTKEIFFFDAVFDVTYTQQGELTQYRVESGARVSDHYDNLPDSISISGSISRFKLGSYGEDVTEMDIMLQKLQAMKKNKNLFTIAFSDDLQPLNNCLFESLEFTQSGETGRHSVDINANITQVRFGARAGLVLMPEPLEAYIDALENKNNSNVKATFEDESETCLGIQTSLKGGDFVFDRYFQQAKDLKCKFLVQYDDEGKFKGDKK